jgi:hypothetical protein
MSNAATLLIVAIWIVVGLIIAATESVQWWAFLCAVVLPGLVVGGVALLRPQNT